MSDETKTTLTILPEETKPSHKKRWLIFLAIFLLVLALLMWFLLSNSTSLDGIKRFFRYFGRDTAATLQFETYGTPSYALVDGRFAIATQGGASLFSEDGSVIGRVQGSFSAPAMKSAGEYLLVYDIGGTRCVLLDDEGETLFDLTAANTIFDADLSADGHVALLYEGTDCHATLEVYEKGGALLYRRNSKTAYLNTCAVAEGGLRAVVTTLGQEDVSFASAAQFLRTDQEAPDGELSLNGSVVYDLAYLDDDTLCAICHDRLIFISDGSATEYAADGSEIIAYSFGGNGYVALLCDPYETGSLCRLTTLDADGEVVAEADIEGTPLALSTCGGYVAVLTEQMLNVYDRSLSLRGSTENTGFVSVCVRSDGTAYCISAGEAELFIP